jgi:cell division protease FtsH
MSNTLGMVEYGEDEGAVFLARDINRGRNYSEHTAQQIDSEVKRLIDEAYATATKVLTQHRDKLDAISLALLEHETLDGAHIKEIMEHGKLLNPPKNLSKPPPPPPATKATGNRPARADDDEDHGLAPDLAGAPA